MCAIIIIIIITTTIIKFYRFDSAQSLSRVQLFATLWTVAHPAPLSMRFPRQEYWSGLPFPSTGEHPNLGIKPRAPVLQADSLPSVPEVFFLGRLRLYFNLIDLQGYSDFQFFLFQFW